MMLRALENRASRYLGTPLLIRSADVTAKAPTLSVGEQRRFAAFSNDKRRREWLCGRSALKILLVALERDDDTENISFPDCQVSLTHAAGIAFAVGTNASATGIGVDFEPLRPVNPRIARWYLDDRERAWVGQQPVHQQNNALIRLWTIKEAAFKSCPDNAGLTLRELSLQIDDFRQPQLIATGPNCTIDVTCTHWDTGYLSVARSRSHYED